MTVTAGNFWSVLTTNLKLQNEFSCRKILESSTFHTTFQANKKHWQHIAGSLRSVTPQWAPKTRLWCVWGDISADGNPSGYRKLPPAMVQVQIWDPKGQELPCFPGVFWGSFFTFKIYKAKLGVPHITTHKKTSQVERIYAEIDPYHLMNFGHAEGYLHLQGLRCKSTGSWQGCSVVNPT